MGRPLVRPRGMVCEQEYELLDEIGRGSYGKVYRAQHDSGEVHAIKVVELEAAEDDLDSIQQEIKMLQAFNCPQLTRYHGSFIVGSALWISMEYLEGGSLQDLMKTSKDNLNEHTTQWILREMLKALVYLHSERKIHRDVKAGNILVASDGSVRLADFGESVQLTHSIAKRQTFAGSPYWMAPEVIMAQNTYNSKADIWSLGVTAIEMIKGRPPYSEMHPMKAVLCIPNNPPPTLGKDGHHSKHFHTFLELCFQRDPNLRPSANDLLKHPFMKAAKQTDALKKLLEARRAAKMMKSLFGGEPRDAAEGSPLLDAKTHRANTRTTTLPASAAAAIAAAQAAAAAATSADSNGNGNGNEGNSDGVGTFGSRALQSKHASAEWDFGDDDEEEDDLPAPAASLPAAGSGALDSRSALPGAAAAAEVGGGRRAGRGRVGMSLGEVEVVPPGSPGVATPKARGGSSGGMWLDGLAEEGDGVVTALQEPPPLAERHRRRGKVTKVGHPSGIDDAAGANTSPQEVAATSRQQDNEATRRQNLGGLGSRMSSKSAASENLTTTTTTQPTNATTSITTTASTTSLDPALPREFSASSALSSPPPRPPPQQQQQQQQQQASSSLVDGRTGDRKHSSGSSGIAPTRVSSSTSAAAVTAAASPARARSATSREMNGTMKHVSSASAAAAAAGSAATGSGGGSRTRGGGLHGEGGGKSGSSMFGRFFRGVTRGDSVSSSADKSEGGVGAGAGSAGTATARPYSAPHDLAAAVEGGTGSVGKEVGLSTTASLDFGAETNGEGAVDQSKSKPASPKPDIHGSSDSVSRPGLPPVRLDGTSSRSGSGRVAVALVLPDVAGHESGGGEGAIGYQVENGVGLRATGNEATASAAAAAAGEITSDESSAGPPTSVGAAPTSRDGGEGGIGAATGEGVAQPWQWEGPSGDLERPGGGLLHSSGSGRAVGNDEGASASISSARRQQAMAGAGRGAGRGVRGVEVVVGRSGGGGEPLESPPTSPPPKTNWEEDGRDALSDSDSRRESSARRQPRLRGANESVVCVSAAAAAAARRSALEDDSDADQKMRSQSSSTMSWGTYVKGYTAICGESSSGPSARSAVEVLGMGADEAPRGTREGCGGAAAAAAVVDDDDDDDDRTNGNGCNHEAEAEDAEDETAAGDDGRSEGKLAPGGEECLQPDSGEGELPSGPALGDESTGLPSTSAAGGGGGGGDVSLDKAAGVAVEGSQAAGAATATEGAGDEEEDSLTPAFHEHLTPALCELWDATEDGSAQRQAVQDLAMALERLDGCSNGRLTLDFVGVVARSWPSEQAASTNTNTNTNTNINTTADPVPPSSETDE